MDSSSDEEHAQCPEVVCPFDDAVCLQNPRDAIARLLCTEKEVKLAVVGSHSFIVSSVC